MKPTHVAVPPAEPVGSVALHLRHAEARLDAAATALIHAANGLLAQAGDRLERRDTELRDTLATLCRVAACRERITDLLLTGSGCALPSATPAAPRAAVPPALRELAYDLGAEHSQVTDGEDVQ